MDKELDDILYHPILARFAELAEAMDALKKAKEEISKLLESARATGFKDGYRQSIQDHIKIKQQSEEKGE